jgi:hypothetical protein
MRRTCPVRLTSGVGSSLRSSEEPLGVIIVEGCCDSVIYSWHLITPCLGGPLYAENDETDESLAAVRVSGDRRMRKEERGDATTRWRRRAAQERGTQNPVIRIDFGEQRFQGGRGRTVAPS